MVTAGAAAVVAWQQRTAALTTTGRLLGTEAQRLLAQPITQATSPAISALAATGWRLAKASDAWNAIERVPLVATLARVTHDGEVRAVAFSPDGKLLATASADKTARLFSVAEGREAARVTPTVRSSKTAFSPDGKLVATASEDKTARLWSVPDGREVARVTHDGEVNAVAFSPDGKLVATASEDKTARLLAAAEGTSSVARVTQDGEVSAVAFSPDGKLVATASGDKTARLLAAAAGTRGARVAHDGAVNAVAFSPDGAAPRHRQRATGRCGCGTRPPASTVRTLDRPRRRGPGGGVQPGRPAARHRQRRRDGAAVGPGHRRARGAP